MNNKFTESLKKKVRKTFLILFSRTKVKGISLFAYIHKIAKNHMKKICLE